jgi:hypothetical protein
MKWDKGGFYGHWKYYFMFCCPCISIHRCNETQRDALFILSLFRRSTSTCFGHICSPSSGGIPYIYNSWYVLCFLVDCLFAAPINFQSTKKHNTYQLLYIYSIPPDDGLKICPKHVEVDWRNKLRINNAHVYFHYTDENISVTILSFNTTSLNT